MICTQSSQTTSTSIPLNATELLDDPWYRSETHTISQQFWRCWRRQRTNNGHPISNELYTDMLYLSNTPHVALETAMNIEQFVATLPEEDVVLLDYAQWIRYWAGKGAAFHLSM